MRALHLHASYMPISLTWVSRQTYAFILFVKNSHVLYMVYLYVILPHYRSIPMYQLAISMVHPHQVVPVHTCIIDRLSICMQPHMPCWFIPVYRPAVGMVRTESYRVYRHMVWWDVSLYCSYWSPIKLVCTARTERYASVRRTMVYTMVHKARQWWSHICIG